MLNGMLIHGLDYDDTYLPGSVHLTASCVPTVLGVAAANGASGEELLVALALGLETAARLGSAEEADSCALAFTRRACAARSAQRSQRAG